MNRFHRVTCKVYRFYRDLLHLDFDSAVVAIYRSAEPADIGRNPNPTFPQGACRLMARSPAEALVAGSWSRLWCSRAIGEGRE